jgi:hypothetical protein
MRSTIILTMIAIALIVIGLTKIPESGPALTMDLTSKSFGEVLAGNAVSIPFEMKNHTSKFIRVIGSNRFCTLGGCVVAQNLPVVIPPHETGQILVRIDTAQAMSNYIGKLLLYTDCPDFEEITLIMTGKIKPRDTDYMSARFLMRGH